MKTGIATVSISGDFREKLSAVAAAGFTGIEIFEADFLAFDASPEQVGEMVRDHGLEICLFQPFRDFEGLPEPHRSRTFERAKRKFDLMNRLGTDLVLICSSVSTNTQGGIDRLAADFAQLGDVAKGFDVRVGYEALAWGKYINDHRDAWEVVRRADHPNVGLILDSFHTLVRGIDPNSIRSIPAEKIFFVQLADAPAINMDLLYLSRHFRNMPGQGDLDVTGFTQALLATGYDDYLSLEIFNDHFRGASPRTTALDGQRSLKFLIDSVGRKPDAPANLVADMPDRVQVDGVEFVEFTASDEEAEQLRNLFAKLGFALGGTHKTKHVEYWQQGDVRLVINCERDGFAHAAYLLHGTSVCDIGINVSNAKSTVSRAKFLNVDMFAQPTSPGELDIPAIRGVGSGIIHFLDKQSELAKVWESEFTPAAEKQTSKVSGIVAIDHISQTMNRDEMLSWVLFYTSLFDTIKSPLVDVIDPSGLVHSQAIENQTGRFRLTLNGVEGHKTLGARFIQDRFGSAVQHIALKTDNIFATRDALVENGLELLQISPNYYDDLDVRYDMEPELLARLRDNNLLYERDENGAFFQFYTKSYFGGFFFEIVERQDAYDGYGATNSTFRIAAQRRLLPPQGFPALSR